MGNEPRILEQEISSGSSISVIVLSLGKRLIKSSKVYIRDSGLLHALLGIDHKETLLGHPVTGMSWEGFVIENILSTIDQNHKPYFYRTSSSNEIDLVLERSGTRLGIRNSG